MSARRTACAVALAAFLFPACGEETEVRVRRARPVTVLTLHESEPALDIHATGVAEPYREERLGFEIAGRVELVLNLGFEAEGELVEAPGEVVREGSVLAKLDRLPYQRAVSAASLRVDSARAGLEAAKIDLDEVAEAEYDQAKAQLAAAEEGVRAAETAVAAARSSEDLARTELQRATTLIESRTISQAEFDAAKNAYDTASAGRTQAEAEAQAARRRLEGYSAALARAEANRHFKKAQIDRLNAEIAELELALREAERNLEDCELRAPFDGRITKTHVSRGAWVQPGAPVVTLTMVDPVLVAVTLSADDERQVQSGRHVRLFPRELEKFVTGEEALVGSVMGKASVADAATRTYRLDVIVRNRRRFLFPPDTSATLVDPADLLPVVERYAGEGGPLHAVTKCILNEGDRHYVYRVPGLTWGTSAEDEDTLEVRYPERVEVVPGRAVRAVSQWLLREIRPPEGATGPWLEDGDILIRSPDPEYPNGIVANSYDWVIRPGDLVPLSFASGVAPRGFFVPVQAVVDLNGERSVYVVDNDVARQVPVSVHETVRSLRRVEGAGLATGARIVVEGVHYVTDGDPVTVVGEARLSTDPNASSTGE